MIRPPLDARTAENVGGGNYRDLPGSLDTNNSGDVAQKETKMPYKRPFPALLGVQFFLRGPPQRRLVKTLVQTAPEI